MKRRIQSMKSMKNIKRKKGTRRAKSMGYKSIKSRKSSVSDNNIETSINAIISDINKKDLSINDKIEMISNELSKLPTIKFYGSLYIPNLSSLDNEDDAIELQNGGTETKAQLDRAMKLSESKLNGTTAKLETAKNKKTEIEKQISEKTKELEQQVDNEGKGAAVDNEKKKIITQEISKLKENKTRKEEEISSLELIKTTLENDITKCKGKLERMLLSETTDRQHIEERALVVERSDNTRARKQAERAEAEEAEKTAAPCKENLLTPFNNLFEKINKNLERFMTTINNINKEQEQEKMKEKLVRKINSLEEKRKKYYDEEEEEKKKGRRHEAGYTNLTLPTVMGTLPGQGADKPKIAGNFNLTNNERQQKYVNFIKEMYEKGYEKSEPSELSDYTKLFTEVVRNDSKFEDRLRRNLELANIKIIVNRLTREDDPGSVFIFYKNEILGPDADPLGDHANYPASTSEEYFHLTIHLGHRGFEGHHYHKGKVHLAKREFDTARNEYIPDRKYSLNMRPYIFTQLDGDNKNTSWPNSCIQVIPIYNTEETHDNRFQIILVEELNKFIWELQIDDVKNKLWTTDKKKMEELMGSYIQAKLPKVFVMLRRKQLTPIIPEMIIEIKKLNEFFKEENISEFLRRCLTVPVSRAATLELIKKCKTLLGKIKQFLIDSNLKYTDTTTAKESDREIFNEFLISCNSDSYTDTKLDIDDQDEPNTEAIEGVINDVESELTSAEAPAAIPEVVAPAAIPEVVAPAAIPEVVAPAAIPVAAAGPSSAAPAPEPTTKSQGKRRAGKERAGKGRKNKITRKKTNKYSIYKIKSKKNKNKQK
jgi:hypothetical protein